MEKEHNSSVRESSYVARVNTLNGLNVLNVSKRSTVNHMIICRCPVPGADSGHHASALVLSAQRLTHENDTATSFFTA